MKGRRDLGLNTPRGVGVPYASPRSLVIATLLLTLVASCFGASGKHEGKRSTDEPTGPSRGSELAQFYGQELHWRDCGDEFQCAKLTVPLDYEEPGGKTVALALIKHPADDPGRRVGPLVVNPGGPGASGVDHVTAAGVMFTKRVLDRFDVIGFDPRGVGSSSPIECLNDRETDRYLASDASPDTPAEVSEYRDSVQTFAKRCEQRSGTRLLAHVSTEDVARDMDVLRAALGQDELDYLGRSYGTFIGATYADLFPDQVGRLVLDGAIDPRVGAVELTVAQGRGFQRATRGFVADCVARPRCPLGNDVDRGIDRIAQFLDSVDRSPLPTSSGRKLTQSLAALGVIVAMYDEQNGWPTLRVALDRAFEGDGSALLYLSDIYTDRDQDGHYKSNQNAAIVAINCADQQPDVRTPSDVRALLPEFLDASPHFGEFLAWSTLSCADWPVQPAIKPHAVHAPGTPPILVIGTTRDPATPYAWAEGLAEQLESGVLLTYEGDGHTAYSRGSVCVDHEVENYLITGTPPQQGTRCR
ncbi:MAG: alpha/beta hydrolase [Carbonactinosporaceae bacterium]